MSVKAELRSNYRWKQPAHRARLAVERSSFPSRWKSWSTDRRWNSGTSFSKRAKARLKIRIITAIIIERNKRKAEEMDSDMLVLITPAAFLGPPPALPFDLQLNKVRTESRPQLPRLGTKPIHEKNRAAWRNGGSFMFFSLLASVRMQCWICSLTASILKLAPFRIGGNSIKVWAALATSCCTNYGSLWQSGDPRLREQAHSHRRAGHLLRYDLSRHDHREDPLRGHRLGVFLKPLSLALRSARWR